LTLPQKHITQCILTTDVTVSDA